MSGNNNNHNSSRKRSKQTKSEERRQPEPAAARTAVETAANDSYRQYVDKRKNELLEEIALLKEKART